MKRLLAEKQRKVEREILKRRKRIGYSPALIGEKFKY